MVMSFWYAFGISINSPMFAGTICQLTPALSASQPQISASGLSVTGKGFVPWHRVTHTGVSSPPHAGRYELLIRMDSAEAANLARQGRDARDDLVVFTVNRVWVENTVPKMDVTVERVRVGYRKETIEVDLTNKQGEGA